MNFASDNTAPVAPAILDAIVKANEGFALGYGNDDWTAGVERRLAEVFEREVAVFLVPTGTAANALALAQVTPPWGVVFCHEHSHIVTDECGAPEFFGGGLKLAGLPGGDGKIAPQTLQAALAGYGGHSPHQMVASALSLTQASEAGTIYRIDEIARLSDIAHARSLAVHMDGARFANALVRLNTTPAQMTWQSGIDVLSFGATKGAQWRPKPWWCSIPARAAFFAERRKRAGQLLSKHRFIAAQMAAYLAGDCWLELARHANAMADRLTQGLKSVGLEAGLAGRSQSGLRRPAVRARFKAQGRRGGLLSSSEPTPRSWRRPGFGAAGDVVCHPRGRNRTLRELMQKVLSCAKAPP